MLAFPYRERLFGQWCTDIITTHGEEDLLILLVKQKFQKRKNVGLEGLLGLRESHRKNADSQSHHPDFLWWFWREISRQGF